MLTTWEAVWITTSLVAKPTEEKIRVNGNFCPLVMLKLPRSSVYVPSPVPFIATETDETDWPFVLFFTLPVIVLEVCEKDLRDARQDSRMINTILQRIFIKQFFR